MPSAPVHSCGHPGCNKLVASRFCDDHRAKRQRANDEHRGSASKRGYDRTWNEFVRLYRLGADLDAHDPAFAAEVLRRNRCAVCNTNERLEFDHIKPLRDGGARLDPSNIQPLCHRHHAAKTMREIHAMQAARAGRDVSSRAG